MIAAVVVTYSAAPEMLDACLAAIRADGGVSQIIVVDTGGTAAPSDDGVELLRIANRGYGAAANAGFRRAVEHGADAVMLLNDDVVLRAGWRAPLVAELTGDRVGAAQPKLMHAGSDLVNSLGVAIGSDGAGTDIGDGEVEMPGGEAHDIEIFSGGAVLLSRAFMEDTGGFDERWFLYYEDVDLALRGAGRGWRYRLTPDSVGDHARSTSTAADPDRTWYLQERNRLWATFRFQRPSIIAGALWLSLRRLRHPPRVVHAKALAAGLAGGSVRLTERARGGRLERWSGWSRSGRSRSRTNRGATG